MPHTFQRSTCFKELSNSVSYLTFTSLWRKAGRKRNRSRVVKWLVWGQKQSDKCLWTYFWLWIQVQVFLHITLVPFSKIHCLCWKWNCWWLPGATSLLQSQWHLCSPVERTLTCLKDCVWGTIYRHTGTQISDLIFSHPNIENLDKCRFLWFHFPLYDEMKNCSTKCLFKSIPARLLFYKLVITLLQNWTWQQIDGSYLSTSHG